MKRLICFVLTVVFVLSFATMAYASGGEEEPSGQEAGLIGEQTEEEAAFSREKAAAVTRIMEIRTEFFQNNGVIDEHEYREISELIHKYYPDAEVEQYLPPIAGSGAQASGGYDLNSVVDPDPSLWQSINLNLPGQLQKYSYYCAPASARAVLKGLGITTSQNTLAEKMGTTQSNGTSLYSVAPALNEYSGQNNKYFHYSTLEGYMLTGASMSAPEWRNQLMNAAASTLIGGYGVIYDCHQVAGSSYYLAGYANTNGVAASTIYHYVAGEGFNYTNSANKRCLYYDPNNNSTLNLGNHHMNINFSTMAVLCNDRGLIY